MNAVRASRSTSSADRRSQPPVFLLQVGVLLLMALVLGRLATRFGMPAVVGELFVGVILGPSFLAHVAPDLQSWLFPADPGQFLQSLRCDLAEAQVQVCADGRPVVLPAGATPVDVAYELGPE